MPLEKQNMPINLFQMPNQKGDPKSLNPGTPTSITNARFNKGGRIDKRTGHAALPMVDRDATALTNVKKIIGTKEHLIAWIGDSIYSWNEQEQEWTFEAPYYSCDTEIISIAPEGEGVQHLILGDFTYFVYNVGNSQKTPFDGVGSAVTVVDNTNNAVIAGPVYIDDETWNPNLFTINSRVYVLYQSSNSIKAKEIDISVTGLLGSQTTLTTDWNFNNSTTTYHNYDFLVEADSRLILAYGSQATPANVVIKYFDEDMAATGGSYTDNTLTNAIGGSEVLTVNLVDSSSADRFFVLSSGVHLGTTYFAIINDDNTVNTSSTILSDNSGFSSTQLSRIYGEAYNDGVNDGIKFWAVQKNETFSGGDDKCFTTTHTITDAGTDVNIDEDFAGMYLLAPPITYSGTTYLVMTSGSPNYDVSLCVWLANGFYTVTSCLWGRGRNSGLYDTTEAWSRRGSSRGTITNPSTGIYTFSSVIQDTLSDQFRVVNVRFDLSTTSNFRGEQFGRSMIIGGSNPMIFDGNTLHELCFFQVPKQPSLAQSTGGTIADGTYSVLVVLEFTTKNGFLVRSAPSASTSITISAGSGTASINTTLYGMNQSNLYRGSDSIITAREVLYITEAGGTIFYRCKTVVGSTEGTGYGYPISYTSLENGRAIYSADGDTPILYTDSGELPATPVPPLRYITTWNNRLWGAGDPESKSIYYSKVNQLNIAPEFSEALTISTQELTDEVQGIKGFSDKLIIASRQSIYFTYGEGPDNLGGGGDFAQIEQVLGVSGTLSHDSMAVTSQGLWYESDRGVYLFDQGMQAQYAGAVFEDDLDSSIKNSVVKVKDQVVVFATGSKLIELDYYFNIWSKSTGITPIGIQSHNGDLYILDDSDQVWKKDDTVFKDDTTSYAMGIESGWMSFAGLTGFQRLYRIFLVCEYKSNHTLRLSIAYDYSSSYTDSVVIDPTDGTDDDTYRFSVHASVQKCQAFRIKLEEVIVDGTSGTHESLQVNFVGLQIGAKRGQPKLKDAQKLGVS